MNKACASRPPSGNRDCMGFRPHLKINIQIYIHPAQVEALRYE